MSTDRQDTSIRDQRVAVERLASERACQIIGEYVDEGISGDKTDKRPSFQRMIADAQHGKFRVILCWDQDRFGRFDSIEAGHWIYPLRSAGVQLITVAQGAIDWNDFAGRIVFAVQQEGKHQFLRDLARNSLRGLIARAKQGRWTGMPPFGYIIGDDGRLELGDPSEIETVREVFRLRMLGVGYRSIARRMNQEGRPAPSGGLWSHDAVRLILIRETYTGVVTLGGRKQGRFFTTHNGEASPVIRGQKSPANPIRTPNAHPAIIDDETFAAAQAMRTTHAKPHWREESEGAPLAGLLYCGCCGSVMYSQSLQRQSGQRNPNYICGKYHKGHGCGHCSVPQGPALQAVAEQIRRHVLLGSPKELERAIAADLRRLEESHGKPVDDARSVRAQIAALDRKIEVATERLLIVDRALVPAVERKLLEMQAAREALVQSTARPKIQLDQLDPKKIATSLWQLGDLLRTASPAVVRHSLGQLVDRIVMEFKPGKATGRGRRFDFVKGTIFFRQTPADGQSSKEWAPPVRVR